MTRVRVAAAILVLSTILGCSAKVVPIPVNEGLINSKDNSLTITRDGVSVTARNADTEINSYNLEGTVSSFFVSIENQGSDEFIVGKDSFLLIDNEGIQYFPLTPEKVKDIISRDSYYLIPYPYVGFYYLEDYERASFYTDYNSQIPYYYQMYPQDIHTRALPEGSIIPNAKSEGLVYFKVDFSDKSSVRLLLYKNGTPKSSPPDFVFPFTIS